MDYEEKYKKALERAKMEMSKDGMKNDVIDRHLAETIFPELVESEDEKVRKAIISGMTALKDQGRETFASVPINDCISWLKNQAEQKQLYIRFGEIPTDEKSKIYRGEIEVGTENGVSVYPAFKTDEGDIVLGLSLPITKTTLYTQQHLIEYDNRPCYLVNGDYIGKDTDGQPLINNVSIIKKIDNYRVKEENQTEQEKDILDDAILDGNEDGLIAATIEYNKKKPKFKIGDFIVNDYCMGRVVEITNDAYLLDTEQGIPFSSKHNTHLWTIADAQSGDILVNWNNTIFIFKAIEDETIKFHIAYNEKWDTIKTPSTKLSHLGFLEPQFEFHPATKEQRDLLFERIKEAGYEWDTEKKELKKAEKKLAWNEEDEKIRKGLIGILSKYRYFYSKEIAWLKSLRDKVQPKQEWSEEDKDYYDAIIAKLEVTQEDASLTDNQMDFLKSLRPQKCLIPSEKEIEKAAKEWDSKANFNPFYMTMEGGKPTGVKQSITTHEESFKAGVNWILKSLKERTQKGE